jgi:hypothetical protein
MGIYYPTTDKLLMDAGVSQGSQQWNGGDGIAVIYGGTPSTTITVQCSFDEGASWSGAHMYGAADNAHLAFGSSHADAKNFRLPPCLMRVDVVEAGLTVRIMSV